MRRPVVARNSETMCDLRGDAMVAALASNQRPLGYEFHASAPAFVTGSPRIDQVIKILQRPDLQREGNTIERPTASHPQIGLPHQIVPSQLPAPALQHDAAGLQHVAAGGPIESGGGGLAPQG